jgi:hypothetical protein
LLLALAETESTAATLDKIMNQHLSGIGALWLGDVYMAEANYHLQLRRGSDADPHEITGTVIAETPAGPGYTLELEDGRTLACTLTMRLGLPSYFTLETTELPRARV